MNDRQIKQFEAQTRAMFWKECFAGNHERALQIFKEGMTLVKQYKRIAASPLAYPRFKEAHE